MAVEKNRFFFGYLLARPTRRGMMTVKPKTASLIMSIVIIIAVLAGNLAYAESISQSVYLTITVVCTLSLNIEEGSLMADSGKPTAEAFSEMKDHNIEVTKLVRNNSDVWLFTKTE